MKKKTTRAAGPRKALAVATQDELKLKIEPRGPEQTRMDVVSRALIEHPSVREFFGRARSQMLSFELLEPEAEVKPVRPSPPPDL